LEEKFCGKPVCRNLASIIPTSCPAVYSDRVGLARVLVKKPRVLPQDETFSSLNAQIRLMMRELLLDVWSEYRMSVLCYSDVDEAGLCGFVRLSLHAGKDVSKRSLSGTARPRSADLLVFRRIHKATVRSHGPSTYQPH
jgi:ABC-type nitrate/sulfonate/bicarbonate transport system ATPase subunit